MAGVRPAQAKLDMVVRIIAVSMVAEVCSLYLARKSGEMELFATEGLDPSAVHVTRMKPGEGLVGEIMRAGRPLNLSDAPDHPAFSYRPETGEDPFHAFMGVPLLRGGRAIGVIVVQNRTSRVYAEDEVEDLQIIAMVLAEMVSAGEVLDATQLREVEIAPQRPRAATRSAPRRTAWRWVSRCCTKPRWRPGSCSSDDPAAEEARLNTAVHELQAQIDQMLEGHQAVLGASYDLLETYKMLAYSRSWNHSLMEAVRSGLTAEAAVERVRSEHRARYRPGPRSLPARTGPRSRGPQRPPAAAPRWRRRQGASAA